MDIKELKFGGAATSIAEDELSACFFEDDEDQLVNQLYADYQADGSPANQKAWLRQRLKQIFLCAQERPQWAESLPNWPFWGGKPMVFINQFQMPQGQVAEQHLSPDVMLYVFGIRVADPEGGLRMEYRVVSQDSRYRDVVFLVDDVDDIPAT